MALADLLFKRSAATRSPHLVFGEDDDFGAIQFAGTLGPPSGAIRLERDFEPLSFAGTLSPPSGSLSVHYDPGLSSHWTTGGVVSWRDGRASRPGGTPLPWRDGRRAQPDPTGLPWRDGRRAQPDPTGLPWRDGRRVRPDPTGIPWRDGPRVRAVWKVAWRDGAPLRIARPFGWRDGVSLRAPYRLPWRQGRLVVTHGNHPWLFPPIEADLCYEPSADLAFDHTYARHGHLVFRCDYGSLGATVVVPVRRVYPVLNSVALTLLDGTPLPALTLSMALDADSWTWRWSATMPGVGLGLLDLSGPADAVATINGASFRLMIEDVSRERQFAGAAVRLGGRGRGAVLDRIRGSFNNVSAVRTAAQLMDDALLYSGWDVDFGLPSDWLVPQGVWAHEGTVVTALRAIAEAAGGYLQPHRTASTVRVLPRYPVAPWEWLTEPPAYELPSAVMSRESIEWVDRGDYNRVFVSGAQAGVLGQVTITGTAGDKVAPMVVDPLITEAAAARGRGLAILGDTGRQVRVSLRLPVLPETGIIEPGTLVRYVDGAMTYVGLVRSVSVEARLPSVSQLIGLETRYVG